MNVTDLGGKSCLHYACDLNPHTIASKNYNLKDLTEEEKEEAIKESRDLKVR